MKNNDGFMNTLGHSNRFWFVGQGMGQILRIILWIVSAAEALKSARLSAEGQKMLLYHE